MVSSRLVFTIARATTPLACILSQSQGFTFLINHPLKLRNEFRGISRRFLLQTRHHLSKSNARTDAEKVMTEDAMNIVKKSIDAVNPYTAIRKNFILLQEKGKIVKAGKKDYDLNDYNEIVIVAFGKASSSMATAVIQQLHGNDYDMDGNDIIPPIKGVVIVKDEHETMEEKRFLEKYDVQILSASHPVPDERSASAAKAVIDLVSKTASQRTLLICCISGGGSALFCKPNSRLTLSDLQHTNSVLLESGLSIQDMNVIRKRLEEGKGGRLAASAYPSSVLSLVLSDVLGDPLDLIASGPTVSDPSTWEDAWRLIKSNGLQKKLSNSVVNFLQDGLDGKLEDSPSDSHPAFKENKCETVLVGNNEKAVEAAANEAARRGYNVAVLGTRFEGEAKHIANAFSALAHHLSTQQQHVLPQTTTAVGQNKKQNETSNRFSIAQLPVALIGGGETTVSLPPDSNGKGGRNQEFALAAALRFQELGIRNVVLASIGTDGTDGPTDAAGAIIDGGTISRLDINGYSDPEEVLASHDAYNYLKQTEPDGHSPLIKTGPTGTNVADIYLILLK